MVRVLVAQTALEYPVGRVAVSRAAARAVRRVGGTARPAPNVAVVGDAVATAAASGRASVGRVCATVAKVGLAGG